MCKAAAAQIEIAKSVRGSLFTLDKARIIGRNSKRRHRRHNLCRTLRKAAKTSVIILPLGQKGKCAVDGVCRRIFCPKSRQRTERHGRHIDVRFLAETPAAVRMLHGKDFFRIVPTRRRCLRHFRILSCTQRQKRPDRAVKTLLHSFFFLGQRKEQVISLHILCVRTGRRQRQRSSCIFRILFIVQNASAL